VFRVKTAALPIAVYQHRLTLTSATSGNTGSIRGLSQTGTAGVGGVVGTTELLAQSSLATTTPPNYNQWYGFGKQEELYYRVDGTAASTSPYTATLTTTPITPTVIAPAFDSNSPITITTVGQTTEDTEVLLYDSAFNLVGQNDNSYPVASSQSRLTRSLTPGVYFLAVSTFELCVSQPAPADDGFFGYLIDFPDCVVLSDTTTISQDYDFSIRACNGVFNQTNQSPPLPYNVTWFQFTAAPGAAPISTPSNDACASAAILTAPSTITANISTATHDGSATCDPGGLGSKDVWYSFTNALAVASQLKVNTCGSTTDTVVTVYNGCGGSEIACNDNCGGAPCGGPGSCITAILAASQNVLIRVSDKGLGGCEFTLALTNTAVPPAFDDCTTPTAISGFGNFPINNIGATTGPQGQTEPICSFLGSTAIAEDVWYTWTATANGTVELTTCGGIVGGPSPDSKISVYNGAGCPTTPSIACNEDSLTTCTAHPFNARVFFTAVCGNTYTFQMGMYPFTTLTMAGTFSVTLTVPGPACNTPSTPVCLGDGTGSPCPCTPTPNNGTAGHGCGSQAFPGGAILTATGIASDETSGTDTLVITATDIPGPALFIQSNGTVTAVAIGDGQLCAAIGIIRLGVVFPTGTMASYPGGLTPSEIHIQGLAVNGQTKHYQAWYRSVPGVCTPGQNYNLSQGLSLTWGP
jgi:hypothetical protein